jgi:hypothetical protein
MKIEALLIEPAHKLLSKDPMNKTEKRADKLVRKSEIGEKSSQKVKTQCFTHA